MTTNTELVRIKRNDDPAIGLFDAGHGVKVKTHRTPWKTAPRAKCAHCDGAMPAPALSHAKYKCEFNPDMPVAELALIGEGQPEDDADRLWNEVRNIFDGRQSCDHRNGCRCGLRGCKCNGCVLRWAVTSGHERPVGRPRKYCGSKCASLADAKRKREARSTARLEVTHPCWLIANGDSQRIEVLRSPLVHDDDSWMEPVRQHIEEHGMVLAARATFDDPDWMHGEVEMSVFVAVAE